jgi:acyl-coenzyme A thioesterase PaaI-like protein
MTIFDDATAVNRRGDGRYDAQADPRFAMVVAPGGSAPPAVNGGVLMATVLRAVLDDSPNPYPVAASANFLRVPQLGPAEVEVTWLKTGRTASTARAAFVQDGLPVVDMTVTTGTLPDLLAAAGNGAAADGESLSWTGERPLFPDIADCVDLGKWPGTDGANGISGFAAHLEVLLDPAVTGWRGDEPSGRPEMRGYVRLREHRDPDALMLALAVDALPPVVFGLGATGWAPTVELTWHMRAVPAAGPLCVAARGRHVSGGWFDEEAEVWDSAGQLVAQSRQLARVGRGRLRPAGLRQAAAWVAADSLDARAAAD